MTLNVAVIGCGNIARHHFSGLAKCGARVKWVCDVNRAAAAPWVEKFAAEYTADYRTAVNAPEVQAVFVTTISRLHKEICLAAINAGKAVVCEKTLAENPVDAWEIIDIASKRGTIFYTSYMKRFIPAIQKAFELLPELGKITGSHIRSHQYAGDLWSANPENGVFATPSDGISLIRRKYSGGVLTCCGSHILDLICYLVGRPERLYASWYLPEGRDYELQTAALLETTNGTVHFDVLWHSLKNAGALRDGWDERVEINGIDGRLEIYTAPWDQSEEKPSWLVYYDNRSEQVNEYRFDNVSPFEKAVAFYCAHIERGEQGQQSIWTGYEVDELLEQIRISSQAHQAITIPWKNI